MINHNEITINKNQTIKEALKVIDKGAMRITIVLDDDKKVVTIQHPTTGTRA